MVAARQHLRVFEDHDVVAYRCLVRRGRVRPVYIEKLHGIGPKAVRQMLTGKSYSEIPGALTPHELKYPDYFGDDVAHLRQEVAARRITRAQIAERYREFGRGPSQSDIMAMLTGVSYAHIPGALRREGIVGQRGTLEPEVVLFMRLAFKPPRVSVAKLAQAHGIGTSTCWSMLRGHSYSDVPEKIEDPIKRNTGKFTPDEILAIRQEFLDAFPHMCAGALARKHGVAPVTMNLLLIGRSHSEIPTTITKAMLQEARKLSQRKICPEVALFIKLQYIPGRVSTTMLAEHYGIHHDQIARLVTGKTYSDLPYTVDEMAKAGMPRSLTDEQVIECRRRFREGEASVRVMARELDIAPSSVKNAIWGYTYKELPGAVPREFKPPKREPQRSWSALVTDEVALFMRLAYDPEKVNAARIAQAYGVRQTLVYNLLTGRTYKHVPMAGRAYVSEDTPERKRLLTDAQVIQGRAWAYSGEKSMPEMARLFEVNLSTIQSMVKGVTYKDLPGAVRDSLRTIMQRAKNRKPIPIRPVSMATLFPRQQREVA
jgi:hypothetical protein